MNVFLRLPPIRCLFAVLLFMTVATAGLKAQNSSPYKQLTTAKNVAVADTISGQNLSIYEVSPLAVHGDVDVILLQSGGAGNPTIFSIRYTPDPGFTGVDTFTIEINFQGSYPYLIYRGYQVSVYPSLITAKSDFAITTAGTPVTTNVLANDLSNNGPLTLTAIPLVNNGTAVIVNGHSIKYTPAPGFSGMGHVSYVVCDTAGSCITGQYSIGVSANPVPVNDSLQIATAKNTAVTIPLTYTGYTVFQAPASGSVLLLNGNSFRYTPALNYSGTDQFVLVTNAYGPPVYKTILIQMLNKPALNSMALDDRTFTPKGTPVTFNVRANDIGNLLVKSWVIPNNLPGTVSGTSGSGNVTFTPNPNFTGIATFYYKIGNMFVPDLEMAAVHVTVGNMNPTAGLFNLTTPKETPYVLHYKIPFTGFNFTVTDAPDHGDCVFYPGYNTLTINGQTVSGYNLLIYTPDNNFVGTDEFEINYCVNANGQCQSVKITMDVVNVYSSPAPHCVQNCVWSGDINMDGVVNTRDVLPLGYLMGVDGPERENASLEWYGQFSDEWDNPYTGNPIDLKHADTDGNGFLNSDDTLAIGLFYGQTHSLTPHIPPSSKGLPFYLNLKTPNPGIGDLVEVEVSLGSSSTPVTDLYGFTFDVSLSPQIIDSAFHMRYFNSTWLNINAPDLWMYKVPTGGRMESVFTRANGISANGYGMVGSFEFIIIDIIHDGKLENTPYFTIKIDNTDCMWGDGSITGGESYTIDIPLRLYKKEVVSDIDFFVYPSPAQDLVQFHLNGDNFIESLSIYDLTGKEVYNSGIVEWEHAELNFGNLPNGFYIAKANTTTGQVAKKFQILR